MKKFSCSVTIDLPRERVIELFDNPDNLGEWQDGFVSFEHLSGTPGEPGAKSKMIHINPANKKPMELIETITVNNLPEEFSGTYEGKTMLNSMENRFVSLGPNQTRWDSDLEYLELRGFMIKLMIFLAPGLFRKQTQKWLDQFKAFAEREG